MTSRGISRYTTGNHMINSGISSYSTGNHVTFQKYTTGGAFENKASYGTMLVIVGYHWLSLVIGGCTMV